MSNKYVDEIMGYCEKEHMSFRDGEEFEKLLEQQIRKAQRDVLEEDVLTSIEQLTEPVEDSDGDNFWMVEHDALVSAIHNKINQLKEEVSDESGTKK